MDFIDKMAEKFNLICYGPIASQKDDWHFNPEFPRNGNEYERNFATKAFTGILNENCSQRGIAFLTLFDDLVDEHLSTKAETIYDQCHLSPHLFPSACLKLSFLLKKNISVSYNLSTLSRLRRKLWTYAIIAGGKLRRLRKCWRKPYKT